MANNAIRFDTYSFRYFIFFSENTSLLATDVRHYFKILSQETTSIAAFASFRVENDESNNVSRLSLFAVLDTSPRVNVNFVQVKLLTFYLKLIFFKRRLANKDIKSNILKSPCSQLNKSATNAPIKLTTPFFSAIPKLSTADLEHSQRLKAITQALKIIDVQTKQFRLHVAGLFFSMF